MKITGQLALAIGMAAGGTFLLGLLAALGKLDAVSLIAMTVCFTGSAIAIASSKPRQGAASCGKSRRP